MTTKMLLLHVPEDQSLLAALGAVTLRHEHLNHILKMTIKSLANLTPAEALDATQYEGSRQLRELIRKLGRQKLRVGEPFLKLSALLTRAERLTEQRNQLTHGLWAKELDGDPGVLEASGELRPIPSLEQLKSLALEILALTNEFNAARFDGFLKIALDEGKTPQ